MLTLKNISLSFGEKQVLKNFSLHLKQGEILAIMGASGLGKSTILNVVAGLRTPDKGSIVSTAQRVSVVFQEPRLFPWLTVYENICAVLPGDTDHVTLVKEALETVSLTDSATLYPSQLSGGMKSRVSLARALAFGGDLFLLDEPFSALDEELRISLAKTLRAKFKEKQISAILITHHQSDAHAMADRIIHI